MLGILCGLTHYDALHYFFHFGWEPTWPFIMELKKNHLKHHFKDSERGFGVSTTLWDRILKTQHVK
jgi:sterol desaturase/sphingolipid hydroxylase (fatty acid hydroxylase superfamily)